MDYKAAARDFIDNAKQFHLGVIPTEQSNPLTRGLSQTLAKSTADGIVKLLSADQNVSKVARDTFASPEFKRLVNRIKRAMDERRTILFSSVGASGRLALQLDATWRAFFTNLVPIFPLRAKELIELRECSNSLMTGGDRAVVRSVENFEDYMTFGARQIDDANVGAGDVVIALAECGLSASINGSAIEADIRGCETYYLYTNPKEILCEHLERCRKVFERPNIIKIPLYVGNMAVAGSTRMQSTTIQLLVAGAAQELAIAMWASENLSTDELSMLPKFLTADEYAASFDSLIEQLTRGDALAGLAKAVDTEERIYSKNGLVTYSAHRFLQDILTDTTERQPTFTLPPFRKSNEPTAKLSWAYAKDPTVPSSEAWKSMLQRPVKGLDWTREDYIAMGAAQPIVDNPPEVTSKELAYYSIGSEPDASRYERRPAALIEIDINGSHASEGSLADKDKYDEKIVLRLGTIGANVYENEICIPVELPQTPLSLPAHLMVKLVFNTLSTATMTKMNRVWSNWMIQVFPTNKKLIDRSIRIIAELANLPYEKAAEEFFRSYLEREKGEEYRESYVVETLRRLGVGGR